MQHEILAAGPLLGPAGELREPGFARRELLAYDPRPLSRLRLKEWDFYATTTREMTFSCAVAHGGVAGVVGATLIDFRTRTIRERALVTPLGWRCALPRSSLSGDVAFRLGGVEVDFRVGAGRREIRLRWPRFDASGAPLEVDLSAEEPPGRESLVAATPLGPRGFFYERKMPAMPTTGRIAAGPVRLELDERSGAFTTLDWGRGVWPYRTRWIWASGAGRLADGRVFGLNLGEVSGDASAATENAFFLDGRLHKLDEVEFLRDPADAAAGPWRLRGPRVELELSANLYQMRKRIDLLAIASDLRQITGEYSGHVMTDAGERIPVAGVIGWAEEHRARW
ncbi:MAG TPA: DUF2804 domain-containing protein [Planctomycetota bacterium]|nr:DUF2804 domain-containing protein [Planctomycetota bacterium]